jgi:hypothetical protein
MVHWLRGLLMEKVLITEQDEWLIVEVTNERVTLVDESI